MLFSLKKSGTIIVIVLGLTISFVFASPSKNIFKNSFEGNNSQIIPLIFNWICVIDLSGISFNICFVGQSKGSEDIFFFTSSELQFINSSINSEIDCVVCFLASIIIFNKLNTIGSSWCFANTVL